MIHPIPPGTRDILPDEMRELRRLHLALMEAFEAHGYGEVSTPTIEHDEVMARGEGRFSGSAYRFFDERGELLSLRSDMTIPIARLIANRYAGAASRSASATSPTCFGRCDRSGGRCGSSSRPGWS